ncbi:hypothetical protein QX25_08795 [Stutzerimonas stutzeri]|nr:hypothetical protein QX25_08795 [Stutzerimonas stutzeri]
MPRRLTDRRIGTTAWGSMWLKGPSCSTAIASTIGGMATGFVPVVRMALGSRSRLQVFRQGCVVTAEPRIDRSH